LDHKEYKELKAEGRVLPDGAYAKIKPKTGKLIL
jgi:hypothetical protein